MKELIKVRNSEFTRWFDGVSFNEGEKKKKYIYIALRNRSINNQFN